LEGTGILNCLIRIRLNLIIHINDG